jgi:hypothetical protein
LGGGEGHVDAVVIILVKGAALRREDPHDREPQATDGDIGADGIAG